MDMDMDDIPAWDKTMAIKTMSGDEATAKQLLTMLVDSLDQVSNDLSRQLREKDWDSIWHTAHKLNGSTKLCCTPVLTALAHDIGIAAKKENRQLINKLLMGLDRQFDRLRTEYDSLINDEPPSAP